MNDAHLLALGALPVAAVDIGVGLLLYRLVATHLGLALVAVGAIVLLAGLLQLLHTLRAGRVAAP